MQELGRGIVLLSSSSSSSFLLLLFVLLAFGSSTARADEGPVAVGPPPPPGTDILLHVRSPAPDAQARLYLRVDGSDVFVCQAPCDPVVPSDAEVIARIDDDGDPSPRWRIDGRARELDVTIRADGGSRAAGWIAIGIGVACAIGGTYLLATANDAAATDPSEGSYSGLGRAFLHALGGGTLAIAGIVLPVAGIVRLTTAPKPDLTVHARGR